MTISANELSKYSRQGAGGLVNAYLKQQAMIQMLRDELSTLAEQHKCGCNHPACNRCEDYESAKEVLNISDTALATTDGVKDD